MCKRLLTTIALMPLLLLPSHAAQRWWVGSDQPFGFSSDESNSTSYLGVDIADITSDRLGALKLKEERGAEVTMVDQDAPAGKAGIKEHDVILSMNGTEIEGKAQLQRMIHETPPGRVITLGLSRDGQPMTIKVQLADRRSEFHIYKDKDWGKDFHIEIPPIPPVPNLPDFDLPNMGVVYVHSSMRSGLMVENLTPQLGEFFGAKGGNGVLVRSVEKGSRGEKAGLRAGDVIVRVGDQFIHDTSDFTHALHSHSAGSVSLVVIREKKEQTLTLTLPQRGESGDMREEDSFASPEPQAENQLEWSQVQSELAQLQPQMELAQEESRKAMDELRKSLCAQKQAMKAQTEQLRDEFGPKVREELEKSRQKLEQQMEQLRQEMRGHWLDI
jgi:serine protease Do